VLKSEKVGGEGGFDYVYADSASRKLFIVRSGRPGGRADAYDLDTLKLAGSIADVSGGHGVAVDAKTGHGFTSSNPIVMFDAKTLATIKTVKVEGNPDGILAEPSTGHIFVLSHRAPNVTVLNGEDGAIVGTIDLGGAPEEGAADGKGHVYIDVEDKDRVAVVDAATNKMTGSYELGEKGKAPAGLSMDAKNGILFCCCRRPAVCVIMNALDGKILETLPIGAGVDAAEFSSQTMESFSSQGDGTLTIIKENSPSSFVVEQTVATPRGAKCSTLDSKTGQIYLTSAERAAPTSQAAGAGDGGARRGGGGRGGAVVPGSFTITVVGK
jgi:DNA-binding beta-propeller fold protein YncE